MKNFSRTGLAALLAFSLAFPVDAADPLNETRIDSVGYDLQSRVLVIDGMRFAEPARTGVTPIKPYVEFGGEPATVTSWSANTLTVQLPESVTEGEYQVYVERRLNTRQVPHAELADGLRANFSLTVRDYDALASVGAPGPAGPQGMQGVVGPAGPAGPQGRTGSKGATGATGAAGAIGPAGPAGLEGAIGPAGPAGPAGVAGVAGAVGPKGATGARGATGVAGAVGATGVAGPAGPIGPVGPVGPVGTMGATGAIGPTGATGAKGSTGPAGPQGPKGDTGSPDGRFGTDTSLASNGRGGDCTLGSVWLVAGTVAGATQAAGQTLSISQNIAVFSLLGTTYGGDGKTTFKLPDLRAVAPNGTTYVICTQGIFPSRD